MLARRRCRSRGQIQLVSGRTIYLRSLRQWQIYAGLLNGLPTVEMNSRLIESLVSEEGKRWGVEPHVLPPVVRPIEYRSGEKYPFGEPAALPEVGCVAYFTSLEPARDRGQDYSAMLIIWFQDEYALPIDPGVLNGIQALDWERLATDDRY